MGAQRRAGIGRRGVAVSDGTGVLRRRLGCSVEEALAWEVSEGAAEQDGGARGGGSANAARARKHGSTAKSAG